MVLDDLNEEIHSQIKILLEEDARSPFEYHDLDIDEFLKGINPSVWEAICLITRSLTERQGRAKLNDQTSSSYHQKKLRRFFLLCAVFFCTDERCSFPLHTLLADMVESQGGSQLLIRILNRFGICASSDTLARFIQHKVKSMSRPKFQKPESFTIVSADNIDFQLSFTRVFCGKQTSSWHGTSIQAVQPLPSLSQCQNDLEIPSPQANVLDIMRLSHTNTHPSLPQSATDTPRVGTHPGVPQSATDMPRVGTHPGVPQSATDTPRVGTHPGLDTEQHLQQVLHGVSAMELDTNANAYKRTRLSPISSPLRLTRSPMPKVQRRLRTGNEKQPTAPLPPHEWQTTYYNHHVSSPTDRTIDGFKISEEEQLALEDLEEEINMYMLHKLAVTNSEPQNTFLNIQDHFTVTRVTHTERSNIIYLQVKDAVPKIR